MVMVLNKYEIQKAINKSMETVTISRESYDQFKRVEANVEGLEMEIIFLQEDKGYKIVYENYRGINFPKNIKIEVMSNDTVLLDVNDQNEKLRQEIRHLKDSNEALLKTPNWIRKIFK